MLEIKKMARVFLNVELNDDQADIIGKWFTEGNSMYNYHLDGEQNKDYLMVVYGILKSFTGSNCIILSSDISRRQNLSNIYHRIYDGMTYYKDKAFYQDKRFRFGGDCYFISVEELTYVNRFRINNIIVSDAECIFYKDFQKIMSKTLAESPKVNNIPRFSLLLFNGYSDEDSKWIGNRRPDLENFTGEGLFRDLYNRYETKPYNMKNVISICFDHERFNNGD